MNDHFKTIKLNVFLNIVNCLNMANIDCNAFKAVQDSSE